MWDTFSSGIFQHACSKLRFPVKLWEVHTSKKSLEMSSLLAIPLNWNVGETSWLLIILSPYLFLFLPLLLVYPPQPGALMINLAAVIMQLACHLPSLVFSGVCSKNQWCWRISQVIFSDLENQRGSLFCRWLAAVTQLCFAWPKHSAAQDTVRTTTLKSGWDTKTYLCSQIWCTKPK